MGKNPNRKGISKRSKFPFSLISIRWSTQRESVSYQNLVRRPPMLINNILNSRTSSGFEKIEAKFYRKIAENYEPT